MTDTDVADRKSCFYGKCLNEPSLEDPGGKIWCLNHFPKGTKAKYL